MPFTLFLSCSYSNTFFIQESQQILKRKIIRPLILYRYQFDDLIYCTWGKNNSYLNMKFETLLFQHRMKRLQLQRLVQKYIFFNIRVATKKIVPNDLQRYLASWYFRWPSSFKYKIFGFFTEILTILY